MNKQFNTKQSDSWSMAEHAEYWWQEVEKKDIPEDQSSKEWLEMYEQWVNFAFAGFPEALDDITD